MQTDNPVTPRKRVPRRTEIFAYYTTDQITTCGRRHQAFGHDEAKPAGGIASAYDFGGVFDFSRSGRATVGAMYRQPLPSAGLTGIKDRLELGRLKKS